MNRPGPSFVTDSMSALMPDTIDVPTACVTGDPLKRTSYRPMLRRRASIVCPLQL